MIKKIKSFVKIIDFQTFFIMALACLSAWLCQHFHLEADIPSSLIAVAIIFPIVFSINAAYRRREEALNYFASMKAHMMSLYYAHRDWMPDRKGEPHAARMKNLNIQLLQRINDYFMDEEKDNNQGIQDIYHLFSEISASHEILRTSGIPANEVSRANQYLRSIVYDFERMRNIYYYRTPHSLRAYSFVFLNAFPILFGPYFAHLSGKFHPSAGYMVAILYSLVLVSLDNIQEKLENPFDRFGEDDVNLDIAEQYSPLMEAAGSESE